MAYKTVEAAEHIIGHLIAVAKSAQVLALRETNPHNLNEIQNIIGHVAEARRKASALRNDQKKEK